MGTERARVFLLDAAELVRTRRALGQGSDLLEPADHRLLQQADAAMESAGLAAEHCRAPAGGTIFRGL
ncbi:MAG: hypothetical protein HYW07_13420 [Candidatus Latescibacteria bacterium]|nr:hypothetical protein [Candidatus Latescibacterota bacterium]